MKKNIHLIVLTLSMAISMSCSIDESSTLQSGTFDLAANLKACSENLQPAVKKAFAIIKNNESGLCNFIESNVIAQSARDENCQTLFHVAVRADNKDALSCLTSIKFDLPAEDAQFMDSYLRVSFLTYMLRYASLDFIKTYNFDPKRPDYTKSHVVFIALREKVSLEKLKYLVSYGAELNITDKNSQTPLQIAIENKLSDELKILLDGGADPDFAGRNKKTPLQIAILGNQLTELTLLLKAGANPNLQGREGNTPLFDAIEKMDVKIVDALIENGSSLTIKNNSGENPLHFAVKYSSEVVKTLLAHGADVDTIDNLKQTPLVSAVMQAKENLYKFVKDVAISVDINERIRNLLQAGANPNVNDTDGNPILFEVLDLTTRFNIFSKEHNSFFDIYKMFIKAGANTNIKAKSGLTLLNRAVGSSYFPEKLELVELTLTSGVNVNQKASMGMTALMYAAKVPDNLDVIKMLVRFGADINAKNNFNESVLYIAYQNEHKSYIQYLKGIGATYSW